MITLYIIRICNGFVGLKVSLITLIIIPYVWRSKESLMSNHMSDRIHQRILQYEHHQEKYRNSLLHDIKPHDLQQK